MQIPSNAVLPPSRFCSYCSSPIERTRRAKFCSDACRVSSTYKPVDGNRFTFGITAKWVPALRAEADRRGVATKVLAKAILAAVVQDNLFDAVLDEKYNP